MERLVKFTYILGAVLVVAGIYVNFAGKSTYATKDEKWMEVHAPKRLGEYSMVPSQENPEQSYSMGDVVRNELAPYGIVCRVYKNFNLMVDVVLIASQNKASFHDPRVCFTAQGWSIVEESAIDIDTPRGKIPATFVKMNRNGENSTGIYFYKGPGGFCSNATKLKFGMFWERIMGGRNVDGVFYRFMPYNCELSQDDLKKFVANYMVEVDKTSNGYF